MKMIGSAEQKYVLEGIEVGVRIDGRDPAQHRELDLEADIGAPYPQSPDQGNIEVTVDISACADQGSASDGQALDLARKLQNSLMWSSVPGGCALDLEALKIVHGKTCWILTVHGLVLSSDGNLVGALSIATKAALADLKIPHIDVAMGEEGADPELDLDDDPENAVTLDTSRIPVLVSVTKVGQTSVLDLTQEEEAACNGATLHIAVSSQGSICGLSCSSNAPFRQSSLREMTVFAQKVGPLIHKAVDSCLHNSLGQK